MGVISNDEQVWGDGPTDEAGTQHHRHAQQGGHGVVQLLQGDEDQDSNEGQGRYPKVRCQSPCQLQIWQAHRLTCVEPCHVVRPGLPFQRLKMRPRDLDR
jgi:hypothetical protein